MRLWPVAWSCNAAAQRTVSDIGKEGGERLAGWDGQFIRLRPRRRPKYVRRLDAQVTKAHSSNGQCRRCTTHDLVGNDNRACWRTVPRRCRKDIENRNVELRLNLVAIPVQLKAWDVDPVRGEGSFSLRVTGDVALSSRMRILPSPEDAPFPVLVLTHLSRPPDAGVRKRPTHGSRDPGINRSLWQAPHHHAPP